MVALELNSLSHAITTSCIFRAKRHRRSYSVHHASETVPGDPLHPWAGLALLIGWVAVALTAATLVFIHRDN